MWAVWIGGGTIHSSPAAPGHETHGRVPKLGQLCARFLWPGSQERKSVWAEALLWMRTIPSALALVSVAATVVWLVRRRRRLNSRRRAPAAAPPSPVSPNLLPVLPPTPPDDEKCLPQRPTLTRSPSRVQLEATAARFGLDIGGSLTKFIYLEQHNEQDDVLLARARRARERAGLEPHLSVAVPALEGTLHFAHFQSSEVEKTVKMLKRHKLCDGVRKIHATGGGAHKYRRLIESTLNTMLSPCNELEAVVLGICLSTHPYPNQSPPRPSPLTCA